MMRSPLAFRGDIRDARQRLADTPSFIAQTALGPISYTEQGDGYPILLVHGIFGGYDAGLRLAEPKVLAGYRWVAPSRFGYPGTPMPASPTVGLQADAHAALLDAFGIRQAVVYAGSAGGTSPSSSPSDIPTASPRSSCSRPMSLGPTTTVLSCPEPSRMPNGGRSRSCGQSGPT